MSFGWELAEMQGEGHEPKLRSFAPMLAKFCDLGRIEDAYKVEQAITVRVFEILRDFGIFKVCNGFLGQGGHQPKKSGGPRSRFKGEKGDPYDVENRWPGTATGGPRPARQ